jgi:hypothetical protein
MAIAAGVGNVSRLILRRMTTAPDASSPTTLQTFLPNSRTSGPPTFMNLMLRDVESPAFGGRERGGSLVLVWFVRFASRTLRQAPEMSQEIKSSSPQNVAISET